MSIRFGISSRVVAVIMLIVMGSSQVAYAIDTQFYSSNDILFYNPDDCSVQATNGSTVFTAVAGNDNAQKIYNFLTTTSFSGLGNKPFTPVQAAGALGNFQQESGMNPSAIEGGKVDSAIGDGHGLAQWSYSTSNGVRLGPGRRGALMDLANSQNKPWSDFGVQLQMIYNEINASYGKSLLSAGFGSVTDPANAAYIFEKIYEGAGIPNQANRDSAAVAYLKKFSNGQAGSSAATASSSSSGSSCTGQASALVAGDNGQASYVTKDGFGVYNQNDPRWNDKPYSSSTIGASGCGPSAMAMIVTALTGKSVTPVETSNVAAGAGLYVSGVGSRWTIGPIIAAKYGLTSKSIPRSVTQVNDALRSGSLIILSGGGASPYTGDGHFIVIRGVTSNGNWLIADSNGQAGITNSDKQWNPITILSNAANNLYAISK